MPAPYDLFDAADDRSWPMVVREEKWEAGTPCWVDLMASDLPRSQAFYREVLGWDYTESQPEHGGYCNATVGGHLVAGMSPTMPGMEASPHVWTTYLATDDSEATNNAVVAAGGQVIVPPMTVGSLGTMAVYVDPTGAAFGTWQSGEHIGFQRSAEPGAVAWNEARVGDFEQGKAFYASLFGYHYQDMSGGGFRYAAMTLDGQRPVGGIGQMEGDGPPRWDVIFAVADTDTAVSVVTGHGGKVLTPAFDMEFGRLAVLTGPDGEAFGLLGPTGG